MSGGGQRPFPKETRSALDIEGKHVTIQGPSPDLISSVSVRGSYLARCRGLAMGGSGGARRRVVVFRRCCHFCCHRLSGRRWVMSHTTPVSGVSGRLSRAC
jgi:hypothetical protein